MKPPFDITRLRLERTLVSLDLETTGVRIESDRIVEIGVCKITPTNDYSEWTTYVNPGIDIPRQASLVHRITTERVHSCKVCVGLQIGPAKVHINGDRNFPALDEAYEACSCETFTPWPTFKDLAPGLQVALTGVDLTGYNVLNFDVEVLSEEFRRVGIRWREEKVLDSFKIFTKYQQRRLTDAYEYYTGKQLEGAHGALVDARAALEVLMCQPHRHLLPVSADELHHVVFELPKPGFLDPDGILKWINGEACLTLKKHPDRPLREVKALDPGYLKWMLKGQFSKGVKAIIGAALEGQFPKEQP